MALNILASLLCGSPNSPLYKNLIECNVAPSFCPGIGYDMQGLEGVFVLGAAGI